MLYNNLKMFKKIEENVLLAKEQFEYYSNYLNQDEQEKKSIFRIGLLLKVQGFHFTLHFFYYYLSLFALQCKIVSK